MKIPTLFIYDRALSVIVNVIIIGTAICAGVLYYANESAYLVSVMEDHFVEWGTFWAFIIAAPIYFTVGRRIRADGRMAWFAWLLTAFCIFVAFEEISWGQRLIGYQPAEYFLDNNRELGSEIHNVIPHTVRQVIQSTVILGFGLILPLLALTPALAHVMGRYAVIAPPVAISPAFVVTVAMYLENPFPHSGEWVELMLGFGFLFTALHWSAVQRLETAEPVKPPNRLRAVLGASVTVVCAAAVSVPLAAAAVKTSAQDRLAAQTELKALRVDFLGSGDEFRVGCGMHYALSVFSEVYDVTFLERGRFAQFVGQGRPSRRAEFMLDPWDTPYWLRYTCDMPGMKRGMFIYSHGPDRSRDSSTTEILGDDIGIFVIGGPSR